MTTSVRRSGPYVAAVDGRESCDHALAIAHTLAMRSGAGLLIVSVLAPTNVLVPPPDENPSSPAPGGNRVEQRRALIAAQVARVLGPRTSWPIELLLGDVEPTITRIALERDAPLIVTGYVHHGSIARFLRRETPLGLATTGEIPVLAIPAGMTHLPRQIVVAVANGEAVQLYGGQRMLFADATTVHLVHVKPGVSPLYDSGLQAPDTDGARPALTALLEVERLLEIPPEVPVVSRILVGPAIDRLLDAAGDLSADLMIVGVSPQSWRSALTGTGAATRLYRKAACAVLLVPMRRNAANAAGSIEISTDAKQWPQLLTAFVQRNCARPAMLEIDDSAHGIRVVASGYSMIGAELEPRSEGLSLSLASVNGAPAHLTHQIEKATVIAFERRETGSDHGIIIGSEEGQCLLTFL